MSTTPEFARKTKVTVDASRGEIERLVSRYGAKRFGVIVDNEDHHAMVEFTIGRRRVRFELPSAQKVSPQRERARWRSLTMAIKAKLDAVHIGISTFEEEFLANIVMADGRRFGEITIPQLEYDSTS